MRVSAPCKLRLGLLTLLPFLLAGCALRPNVPAAAPAGAAAAHAPHQGVPHPVATAESLLLIRVYRAGTLASAGHNHLIACHALTGTIYLPADVLASSFELRFPVAELTVDEEALRADEHSPDFPPQVPDSAREGTRRNMLSAALLDAEHYPQVELSALKLESGAVAPDGSATVRAHIEVAVKGQRHEITVPVSYRREGDSVIASGATALRQSELGLTPFSALLGALQVQDEMRLSFRIVAHAAR
jgi:polyisoprenoid-binding protein YceI